MAPSFDWHPATRLVVWMALVVIGQGAVGVWLGMLLATALVSALVFARGHLRRLLRRARVLLLTIALLFAWSTPGSLLWPAWGSFSPSEEGLVLALLHGGRLLLVLALLALLLQFSSAEMLVAGIYSLLKPFAPLRLARDKVALRLLLVLQYAELQKGEGRRRSWQQWLDWLEESPDASLQAVMTIPVSPMVWRDRLVLFLALVSVLGVSVR